MSGENSRLEALLRRYFAPLVVAILVALVAGWFATEFFFDVLVHSWLARVQRALGDEVSPEAAAQVAARLVTIVLTFLGGLVVAGMWVWRNAISSRQATAALDQAKVANAQAETAREQAKVALKTQISTDLTQAFEQLGSDKMAVRIGAIYTLEKVMRDVQDTDFNLYWSIIETLSGFAREQSKKFPTVQTLADMTSDKKAKTREPVASNLDITCVLTVIGRRRTHDEDKRIDLTGLFAPRFSAPDEVLDFSRCDLSRTVFEGAALNRCRFAGSTLTNADLSGATLLGANLSEARLESANLSGSELLDADLNRARLIRADLSGAWLERANLSRADLGSALDLTQAQIDTAHGDENTQLPEGLVHPADWLV